MAANQGLVNMRFTGNSEQVAHALERLDTATSPASLAAFLGAKVSPYVRSRMKSRFDQQGDDVTGPWAPLSDATKEIRANMGYGATGPINKRTGDLEDYLVNSPANLSASTLGATLVMPGSGPAGADLREKLETAQRGKDYPRTKARPVLGVNEQDLSWVLFALTGHVTDHLV